jgi:hypothetical protein
MKKVECWRWRYRDPQLGCIRCTTAALTEQEAAAYPESERIDGTLSVREIDESSVESATPSAVMGLTRSRPRDSTPVNTCRAAQHVPSSAEDPASGRRRQLAVHER